MEANSQSSEALLQARIAQAKSTQHASELCDPIEFDPEYRALINAAETEAAFILKEHENNLGFCHMVWGLQQEILSDKYQVIWFTPAEMNEDCLFD